jgi:hypothetical protein
MTSYVPVVGQDGSKAVLAAGLFNRPGDALRPVWPVRALTGRVRTAGFDLVQVLALPLAASGSINKVLRFRQAGHCSSPRLTRSNRDLSHGRDLAVKGDALIHRPCLVAGLVGSEWRTRRPV